jgi:6-pyruvoyl-tetrahydropterin synthase
LTAERSPATAHRLSRYDGVCGNVHGHNIEWEVELHIEMTDESHNMPLDFKDVADLLDRFDHALTVAHDDEMLELDPVWGGVKDDADFPVEYQSEVFGQVWVFEGDPTCEVLSQYVANELVDIEPVFNVEVTAWETDKYGMGADSW